MSPRSILVLTMCFVAVIFISLQNCGPVKPAEPVLPPNIATLCFCADSTKKDSLCSDIPHEIAIPAKLVDDGYRSEFDSMHQPYFDNFSWQSFVALNWPAGNSGQPVQGAFTKNFSSPRVWESYADPDTVFTTGISHVPEELWAGAGAKKKKLLYMRAKFQDIDSIGLGHNPFFEADGNALIDQNLNYVVYEEKINPDEFNYIDTAGLRTQAGQQAYTKSRPISLPSGFYADPQNVNSGITGAIEIKASWRILVPGVDSMDRFYHQPAIIYIDAAYTTNQLPLRIEAEVGLVGMHIIHKTGQGFGQFMVWSTFEHVDNVPDNLGMAQVAPSQQKKYSFYNPGCIGCPVNTPPVPKKGDKVVRWSPDMPYAREYAANAPGENGNKPSGTQVVRMYPVYYYTDLVNGVWQQKLEGTVWANYRLIGSQWGGVLDGPPPADTVNSPQFLGNTTLETYLQESASCMTCHARFAKIAGHGDSLPSADFSFLFSHATVTGPSIPKDEKPRK